MRGEHMPETRLWCCQIATILVFFKKSWSLNTMVRAVVRPEAELTLFLHMCTKEIAKSLTKCMPIEELFPCYSEI